MGCHGKNMEGGMGPNLQKIGSKYDATQIADIITNGKPSTTPGGSPMPGGMMKDEAEIKKLAEYMASLK
jgi:menaquinol-cytochrome c reductase cytochrome b/c subunit